MILIIVFEQVINPIDEVIVQHLLTLEILDI